jgi:hypothetical protein
MGIAALVIGIVGLLAAINPFSALPGAILSVVATVLGVLGRKSAMRQNLPTGMSTAGMALGICGVVIGATLFAVCAWCTAKVNNVGKSVSEAIEKAQKEEEQRAAEEAKIVRKVGDTVVFDGDSSWVIVSVKDHGHDLAAPRAPHEKHAEKIAPAHSDGRFIEVRFKITNLGKSAQLASTMPKLLDAKGREFAAYENDTQFLDEKSLAEASLPPGLARDFEEIYEVPADAQGLKIQTQQLAPFGHPKMVQLGL